MSDVWNLPNSWVQVTVADLGKVVSGGTPSTKENSYWGGNISWISPSDLTGYSKKHIAIGAKSITQEGLKNSSATIMTAGSIHFSSRAPIGYTVISSCDMTTNQGFKSLVPAQGVFNDYIYYYFKSAKQLAESKATGTTFKEISGAAFNKLPVPLPPTNEQHRIVAKIEELFSELDKGIENLKTARAQLKVYRQALLKHAFEGKLTAQWRAENQDKLETADAVLKRIQQERTQRYEQQLADWEAAGKQGSKPKAPKSLPPFTAEELAELPELPEGWGWMRVQELADKVTDGEHITPRRTDSGYYLLSARNIQNGYLDLSNVDYVPQDEYERIRKRCNPEEGDILISCSGSIGRICRVPKDLDFVMVRSVAVVKLQNSIETSKFYEYLFQSPLLQRQIEKGKKATAQANLFLEPINNLKVVVCSRDEQMIIIGELEARLSEADQLDQTLTIALQQAEALRQSILKKAFSGQLVAQDPNDEPAAALLARIKAQRTSTDQKSALVTRRTRKETV